MNRLAAKESQMEIARLEIQDLAKIVKKLTQKVKNGSGSKRQLTTAVNALEKKTHNLKILTQESKVMGDWVHSTIDYVPEPKSNLIWVLVAILTLIIIS